MNTSDRLELLAQVATWYYEDKLDQKTIAERISRSPSMVSRMLQEAHERGLVEIRIRYPLKTAADLERRLCETFSLSQAAVLAAPPAAQAALFRRLGELGARCLQQQLHEGIIIGIGWGTAVYEVVRAMPALSIRGAKVIQVIGSIGSGDPTVDGSEMTRWLAQKLNAPSRFLHAPLIVQNEMTAQALFQDPATVETLAQVRQIEVALVGVGIPDPAVSGLRRAGYLSEMDLRSLQQSGAVGDILGIHMDANGRPLDIPLNRRVIGIDLESLRSFPTSIVIASGAIKVPAILAALRGGYVDVLITDAVTTSAILARHEEQTGVEVGELVGVQI